MRQIQISRTRVSDQIVVPGTDLRAEFRPSVRHPDFGRKERSWLIKESIYLKHIPLRYLGVNFIWRSYRL